MHFEIPEALTREVYLQIARKSQACVRREAYTMAQAIIKSEGKDKISDEELDAILEKIGNEKQESFRVASLKLFGVELPQGELGKHLLQKAYLKFSTISSIKTKPGEPAVRSRWNEQIQQEQKVHSEILTKIQNGERVDGIEKDPLLSTESDLIVDYSSMPGFLQREKSISGNEKLRIQPHASGLKAVGKVLQKARDIKAHHHEDAESKTEVIHEQLVEEDVKNEEEPIAAEVEQIVQVNQIVSVSFDIVEEEKQADEVKPVEAEEVKPVEVVDIIEEVVEAIEEVIQAEIKQEEQIQEQVIAEVDTQPEEIKENVDVAPVDLSSLEFVTDRAQLAGCEEAKIAKNKSYKVELKQGETYYYCTCGRSESQPFCDGSHNQEGCTYKPLKFTHEKEDGEYSVCGCKHNNVSSGAFCDGSHKNLPAI